MANSHNFNRNQTPPKALRYRPYLDTTKTPQPRDGNVKAPLAKVNRQLRMHRKQGVFYDVDGVDEVAIDMILAASDASFAASPEGSSTILKDDQHSFDASSTESEIFIQYVLEPPVASVEEKNHPMELPNVASTDANKRSHATPGYMSSTPSGSIPKTARFAHAPMYRTPAEISPVEAGPSNPQGFVWPQPWHSPKTAFLANPSRHRREDAACDIDIGHVDQIADEVEDKPKPIDLNKSLPPSPSGSSVSLDLPQSIDAQRSEQDTSTFLRVMSIVPPRDPSLQTPGLKRSSSVHTKISNVSKKAVERSKAFMNIKTAHYHDGSIVLPGSKSNPLPIPNVFDTSSSSSSVLTLDSIAIATGTGLNYRRHHHQDSHLDDERVIAVGHVHGGSLNRGAWGYASV
jgi:hypothetical protein